MRGGGVKTTAFQMSALEIFKALMCACCQRGIAITVDSLLGLQSNFGAVKW